MKTSDKNDENKNGKKSPYPPNVSVNNYTDPVYTTVHDDTVGEAEDKKEEGAPDEPVESWGWINNVD